MNVFIVLCTAIADADFAACNHPSLVSQDYRKDKEAVEPKAAQPDMDLDDGDADELADLIGGMGLAGATKCCQLCQKAYVQIVNMLRNS